MKKVVAILLLSCIFSACVKDKPEEILPVQVQLSNSKKVYVINEGNYGSGNSSFTLYDVEKNESIEDLYFAQNSAKAGDVAQSLTYTNGRFYLVMNNSKRIIVCDGQFKKTGEINGLTSPRFMVAVTNQKAYVSDLYGNAIAIVNLNTQLKTGEIKCGGKTEKMAMIYNKVFVTNTERAYVYEINTNTDMLVDSIYVGLGASSSVIDRNDKLWVLASGNTGNLGRLTKINSLSNQIEAFWEFNSQDSPWSLCLNASRDTLFYLNKDIYRMSIAETSLPAESIVKSGTKNFYGIGIHPTNFTLFASDALDYSQRSNIYIYDQAGKQLNLFKAGVNANSFYFE